jgi:hypothetical protein
MSIRHALPQLPGLVVSEQSENEIRVCLPEGLGAAFRRSDIPSLSSRIAGEIVAHAGDDNRRGLIVVFKRSSAEARDALRDAGISFIGEDGYVFVRAPGLYVERDRPLNRGQSGGDAGDVGRGTGTRNPFANRSSRVSRWLLTQPDSKFSPSSVAKAVELNPAAVSRILTALEDAGFISETDSGAGRGRSRTVKLTRSLALLEEWLAAWQRRRIQRWRWDVGARDADEALQLLRAVEDRRGWAIGGLAGAAAISRAVEPSVVALWLEPAALERLTEALQPATARGGRGALELALAPDPWTLGPRLTRSIEGLAGGLPLADPAQLWLDCASEGERALEAADAIAQLMSWT